MNHHSVLTAVSLYRNVSIEQIIIWCGTLVRQHLINLGIGGVLLFRLWRKFFRWKAKTNDRLLFCGPHKFYNMIHEFYKVGLVGQFRWICSTYEALSWIIKILKLARGSINIRGTKSPPALQAAFKVIVFSLWALVTDPICLTPVAVTVSGGTCTLDNPVLYLFHMLVACKSSDH